MALSRSVSKTLRDISRNCENFPTRSLFNAHAKGVPLGIGYTTNVIEKLERWGYLAEQKVW